MALKKYLNRIYKEIFSPYYRGSRLFIFGIRFMIYFWKFLPLPKKSRAIFIFDVRTNSITYDFANVLYLVYKFFEVFGFSEYEVIVFTPESYKINPFESGSYSSFVSSKDIHARIDELIIPLALTAKCVSNVQRVNQIATIKNIIDSSSAYIYPPFYDPNYYSPEVCSYRRLFDSFSKETYPPSYPGHRYITDDDSSFKNNILDCKSDITKISYITLTLRDYGFSPLRNTIEEDIFKAFDFAKYLNCELVIVPDSMEKLKEYKMPSNIILSSSSRFNLNKRIYLYSESKVNIFSVSGPRIISLFIQGSKTIAFRFGNGTVNDPNCDSSLLYYKIHQNLNYSDQPDLPFQGYSIWHSPNKDYSVNDLIYAFGKLN